MKVVSSSSVPHEPTTTPRCTRCDGAGYYLLDVPIDDPGFGILRTCECRYREKDQRRLQELRQIGDMEVFASKTFATFDAQVPGVMRAFRRAQDYAKHRRGWLILFGNYGCGKTHLAAAVGNEVLRQHDPVIFAAVPDLLDHLRVTYSPNSDVPYDERFRAICNVYLLILDDLGTEQATPWAREKLYQIINHRYNHTLPTIITSNRQPEDIDLRIFSRLADRALCEEIILMDAGDYRKLTMEERRARDYRRLTDERVDPRLRARKR